MNHKSTSLLSLDAARQILAQSVVPLPPMRLSLDRAFGSRFAEVVYSDIDLPHWDVSAMDGYAVRALDLGKEPLPVAFEVRAGEAPSSLPTGFTCRIFTGSVIPEGADTVVPQEQAKLGADGRIRLEGSLRGRHIRHRGEVLAKGTQIAQVGDLLTPSRIALLAAGGAAEVSVTPRPRVAVVMTGSELVGSDRQPSVGAIRDSNGPMLRALIEEARFSFAGQFPCPDDLNETYRAIDRACRVADLVVTSGGVSVGDWDFVTEAVRRLGGDILFHRLAIKPGKPALAARLEQSWIVGLPGNPVSVLVCWRMLALPLGLALSGDFSLLKEKPQRAVLTRPLQNSENRLLLHPATLDPFGEPNSISPLPWKGSHDLASAAQANVLIRLGAGVRASSGDEVEYYPLN